MEPTLFTQDFTLKQIMESSGGFTLTADKEAMKPRVFDNDEDVLDDDVEDTEEVMKTVEASTQRHMLAAPQYRTFDDLATKMTNVEDTDSVKILILEDGTGPLVPPDSYVKVHYAAYWEREAVPFDNTLAWNNSDPVRLRMGYGAMMPGLEIGLAAVHGPTAKFQLLLAPEAMCGKVGALPRIRPETALYCVTLVGVEDIGLVDRFTSLPSAEQKKFSTTVQAVQASNTHAKDLFAKSKFTKAIQNYLMSLDVLNVCQPETDEEMEKVKELMTKVYVNLAVCYSKLHNPKKVLLMCDNVTRVSSIEGNCQALYLYGKAYASLGEYTDALKFMKMALKLQPKNPDIAREMTNIDKKVIDSKEQERSMWKGAFSQKKTEVKYNVTEEFKEDTKIMLDELSEQDGFVEFRLPVRMSEDELGYTKKMLEAFEGMVLKEEDRSGAKKYSIVKRE